MTDNEIKKASEEWIKELKDDYKRLQLLDAPMDCFEESHIDNIRVLSNALDLINRLQAENEKSKEEINRLKAKIAVYEGWEIHKQKIKAEAYKECIERVKGIMRKYCGDITEDDLDNLLKEMVGGK